MATIAEAMTALSDRIEMRRQEAQTAIDEAFAAALSVDAPVRTGVLAASVTPTQGGVTLLRYGLVVARGTPALSGAPRAKDARARYAARVGRAITHPNDFIARAWNDPAVIAVRAQYPDLQFTLTVPPS